jgi:hypothetical protein
LKPSLALDFSVASVALAVALFSPLPLLYPTPGIVFRKFINVPFVVSLSNPERNTLKKLALLQAHG